jgi:hypothetical protein
VYLPKVGDRYDQKKGSRRSSCWVSPKANLRLVDSRSGRASNTYRFEFFSVASSIKGVLSSGSERPARVGFFEVPADQAKYVVSDREDVAEAMRRHMADQRESDSATI